MVWTVKYTYEHWSEDVLLVMYLGLPEAAHVAVNDPRVLNRLYIRSDDRRYGEVYLSWENKEKYISWKEDYPEWNTMAQEHKQYVESFGIVRAFYEPFHEDYHWETHPSNRPDRVQFPKNAIQDKNIFDPPNE